LLHYAFIAVLAKGTIALRLTDNFALEFLWQALLLLPPLLLVCAVFFVLIERPCMRPDWPRRLFAFFHRAPPASRLAAASGTGDE
jgi:peptidoglycan/LPS O-acetylase OafA/YrhL